jgi:hypothetical protein
MPRQHANLNDVLHTKLARLLIYVGTKDATLMCDSERYELPAEITAVLPSEQDFAA